MPHVYFLLPMAWPYAPSAEWSQRIIAMPGPRARGGLPSGTRGLLSPDAACAILTTSTRARCYPCSLVNAVIPALVQVHAVIPAIVPSSCHMYVQGNMRCVWRQSTMPCHTVPCHTVPCHVWRQSTMPYVWVYSKPLLCHGHAMPPLSYRVLRSFAR